ncbi:FtsW/RodA/SpoVE family cell cycle protein [Butyrivibrio fibrisolvens]|uniref:FtsW/RodA/SpoVE family cell cycle protein n=1 Tax=Butyrivibrio fibrisolvens TaxID=831 RepID=UPI0003FAA4B5|nr:FtsW/RodA/SpoVE family cell cycle protein [Butyrivibrio fibrisolvens]
MEEYLKAVIEQIRCKNVRPYVERELRDHLEDQINDNIASGMDKDEAVRAAVKDMGDPIETGIALDRVHRPSIAWGMIALVFVISIAAALIHFAIASGAKDSAYNQSSKTMIMFGAGFLVMLAIYFVDYTHVARFSKLIALCLIGLCIYARMFGTYINGAQLWIRAFFIDINVEAVMMLYVPVFAGILYKYRNGSATSNKRHSAVFDFIKILFWMIVPVFFVMQMPALVTALMMLISMLTLLTIATSKGWFKFSKPIAIASIWGVFVGLPVIGSVVMFFGNGLADYQKARLVAFFTGSGEANYLTNVLRNVAASCRLYGSNGVDASITIPEYNSAYVLSYISITYGLIAGILIACALAALIAIVFGISLKQKNQLGMLMGCGCGMVLLVTTLINIFQNLGWFPPSRTFLPLMSSGGSYIIVTYILIGIVLSIYKYKSIYPKHVSVDYRLL